MPARKGLLTPQNNFLDTIARRFDGTHSNFVLGNAQAPNFPIVYCSDGFCELTGFPRSKIMSRNCSCQFLVGPSTNPDDATKIAKALDEKRELKIDVFLYKCNGLPFWCLLDIVPIKNEKGDVVLFLVSYKDVTKDKMADMDNSGVLSLLPFLSGSISARADVLHRRFGEAFPALRRENGEPFDKARRRSRAVLYHLSGQFDNKKRHLNSTIQTMAGKTALPEYKVQEAEKSRCIILHYGLFKIAWDWLILLCTFYIAVIVPYNAAFITSYNASLSEDGEDQLEKNTIYPDVIVEILFIADMILNFRTTFVSKSGQVMYNPRLTALNYIKSWFFLDLLAAIPFDLLYVLRVKTSTVVPLLKIARLLRLARLLQKIDRFSQYSAVVLTLLMSMYALIAHWMACIWFAIGYHELHKDSEEWKRSWMYTLALHLHLPIHRSNVTNSSMSTVIDGPPPLSSYVSSLYFATTVLTSVGFGNVAANTDSEKIFSVVAMMIGALMHAAVFGNVTAIIQRLYARKATYHSKTRDLKDFFRTHHIPKPLKTRMQEFFQTTWSLNNGIDNNDILKDFPEELKSDIAMHLHKEILSLSLFYGISPGCMKMLALVVKTTFSAPGETLLTKGDAVHHVYFICSGSMEILKDDLVVAILGKGDLFGCDMTEEELCEQTVIKSGVTARSLTYCMLQCLSVRGVSDVMAHYPETADKLLYDLKQELTYDLRESFQGPEDSAALPLPSISEDEEDDDHHEDTKSASQSLPRASLSDRGSIQHQPLSSSQSAPQVATLTPASSKKDISPPARKASYEMPQAPKRSLVRSGSRKLGLHGNLKGQKAMEETLADFRQEIHSMKVTFANVSDKVESLSSDIARMHQHMQSFLQPSLWSPKAQQSLKSYNCKPPVPSKDNANHAPVSPKNGAQVQDAIQTLGGSARETLNGAPEDESSIHIVVDMTDLDGCQNGVV